MNPDSFVLDEENQYVKARASRGEGPHTPARGGKLLITDHRTLFITKTDVEAIPHKSLNGLTVKHNPVGHLMKYLAGLLGIAALGFLVYWAGILGFDISTWTSLLMPFAGVGSAIVAALAYRKRREEAYETLILHLPGGDRAFSGSTDASFTNASKIISKNWRRRAPKF